MFILTVQEEKKDSFGKYSSNFILKRHMRQTRDFIAKKRVKKKSQVENNSAENQIEFTGNVEEKNCSSNEMDRDIIIEPVENILVETCSSLD